MAKNPRLKDMSGMRFGELVVLKQAGNTRGGAAIWLCKCDCGAFTRPIGTDLRKGKTKSCGHNLAEITKKRFTTHGDSKTRLHNIWKTMLSRCKSKNNPVYGGRGITVCEEWLDYPAFKKWAINAGYENYLTIERNNNDAGYSPDNCRWATKSEQACNRSNVAKTKNGVPWLHVARKHGITDGAYRCRIHMGWEYEEAATWPMFKNRPQYERKRNNKGQFT